MTLTLKDETGSIISSSNFTYGDNAASIAYTGLDLSPYITGTFNNVTGFTFDKHAFASTNGYLMANADALTFEFTVEDDSGNSAIATTLLPVVYFSVWKMKPYPGTLRRA